MSTLIIVTGASRGFGYACARRAINKISSSSSSTIHAALIARNVESLNNVKQDLETEYATIHLHVLVKPCDLQSASDNMLKQLVEEVVLESGGVHQIQRVIVIHNAGSIGTATQPSWEGITSHTLTEYFQLNLFSATILQAHVTKVFEERLLAFAGGNGDFEMFVVNISSLAGVKPFTYLPYYCTGKAARDMWFRCLADEAKLHFSRDNKCALTVLSYAPGPMVTDLFNELLENAHLAPWVDSLKTMKEEGKTVDLNTSADKMLRLLLVEGDKWQSGDHLDIFDDL